MKVLFGLTEKDSTTGPRRIFTLPGAAPPLPARAVEGSKRASGSESARRGRTLLASVCTPDCLRAASDLAADYQAACMRVISSSAPVLFSGSLRFPHFGDCTHEGQP